MPIPEPIPRQIDISRLPTNQTQFSSIDEIDQTVQFIIWNLAQDGIYTGPGCVQEELFRSYPAAFSFLHANRILPDNIPRLAEHRKLIQRVNTQLWAYATVKNVITLGDLEKLVQAEAGSGRCFLGPIYCLPAAMEIFQTTCFHPPVMSCFRTNRIERNAELEVNGSQFALSGEQVLREFYECLCSNRFRLPVSSARRVLADWWQGVFTHHMLVCLGDTSVPVSISHRDDAHRFRLQQLAPYGIRINGFPFLLQSMNDVLRPENLTKAAGIAQQCLDQEIRAIYDENVTKRLLHNTDITVLGDKNPTRALKRLATTAKELHSALLHWAESRSIVWPAAYMSSLLSFSQAMEKVCAAGPFRRVLPLLLALTTSEPSSVKKLFSKLRIEAFQPEGVIDLTDSVSSPVEVSGVNEPTFISSDTDLSEVVRQFCDLVHSAAQKVNSAASTSQSPMSFWQSLFHFEGKLMSYSTDQTRPSTLVKLLADADAQNLPSLPKALELCAPEAGASKELSSKGDEPRAPTSVTVDFNPQEVLTFLSKLTCLGQHSLESVCQLVTRALRISRSTELDQTISTMLTSLSSQRTPQPVMYYGQVLTPTPTANPVSSVTIGQQDNSAAGWLWTESCSMVIFTQRDEVLTLLSGCPILEDLAQWSQWYSPGMLSERWGRLEDFLLECGYLKVCVQYNLIALRLLQSDAWASGASVDRLLRFTAYGSPEQLSGQLTDLGLSQLSGIPTAADGHVDCKSSSVLRSVADSLLTSALELRRGLTVPQVIDVLQHHLSTDAGRWTSLIRLMFTCLPPSTLGPVLTRIIVPAVEACGLRPSASWPNDSPDWPSEDQSRVSGGFMDQLFNVQMNKLDREEEQRLVSAVGCLGLQLSWPAYVQVFERRRLALGSGRDRQSDLAHVKQTSTQLDRLEVPAPENAQTLRATSEVSQGASGMTDSADGVPLSANSVSGPPATVHDGQLIIRGADIDLSSRQSFIDDLRRREFGCGADLNKEASELVQRVEAKLRRSLVQLSEDLYGNPGHFLLELIQNADDNTYRDVQSTAEFASDFGHLPTLEFRLVTKSAGVSLPGQANSAMLVMNNEAAGFSESDMASLCDVGLSGKGADRASKTGRKGIGFKSVFNITDAPEVHSNGFHVRFNRQTRHSEVRADASAVDDRGVLLLPEWCTGTACWPVPLDLCQPSWCTTLFVLPLSSKPSAAAAPHSQTVIQLAVKTLSASVMLFLRRLSCLTLSTCLVSDSAVVPSPASLFSLHRAVQLIHTHRLNSTLRRMEVVTVLQVNSLATKTQSNRQDRHCWFCYRETIPTPAKNLLSGDLPRETEISLAVSLSDSEPLTSCPVSATLPVCDVGLKFYINADFDLTSSREDVDGNSAWNQWLVGQVPLLFANMIVEVLALPCSRFSTDSPLGVTRQELLTRILVALPTTDDLPCLQSSGRMFLFASLPAQLCHALAGLAWLPASTRDALGGAAVDAQFVTARELFFTPVHFQSAETSPTVSRLTHLLIDRLGMFEPHPDLLSMREEAASMDWQQSCSKKKHRRAILTWLGVRTISVDAILDLASKLSTSDLLQPGMLSLILHNLEVGIINSSNSYHHLQYGSTPGLRGTGVDTTAAVRRRVLTALSHLTIFSLAGGGDTSQLISLSKPFEAVREPLAALFLNQLDDGRIKPHLSPMLPPHPAVLSEHCKLPYDHYIALVSSLGPVISPSALFSTLPTDSSDVISSAATVPLLSDPPPRGLGLPVALPETVLTKWVLPLLETCVGIPWDTQGPHLDWLLSVGRLYALAWTPARGTSDQVRPAGFDSLPRRLPIVVTGPTGVTEVVQPLAALHANGGLRNPPVFLPVSGCRMHSAAVVESDQSSSLEDRLYQLVREARQDRQSVKLVSMAYFSCTHLNAVVCHAGWNQLFFEAGVVSLFSLHPLHYVISSLDCLSGSECSSVILIDTDSTSSDPNYQPLLPLPKQSHLYGKLTERLREDSLLPHFPGQSRDSLEWTVEDFESPGLELLIDWIVDTWLSSSEKDRESAREAANLLTCLLHSNWPKSFQRFENAVYRSRSTSRQHGTFGANPLGPSSWLHRLRKSPWLPTAQYIDHGPAPTVTLMVPAGSVGIYSPALFCRLRQAHSADLADLLEQSCCVWVPGSHLSMSLISPLFTKALGLVDQLECSAFESLMIHLANDKQKPCLSPALMSEIYRAAIQCSQTIPPLYTDGIALSDAKTLWLRSVFASAQRPCILVACLHRQGHKVSRLERTRYPSSQMTTTGSIGQPCPVCTHRAGTPLSGRKRRSVHLDTDLDSDLATEGEPRSAYHLVPPSMVCWVQSTFYEDVKGEGEEAEEDVEHWMDQCLLPASWGEHHSLSEQATSVHVKSTTTTRPFALSSCYGSEWRNFFLQTLGLAFTSSLKELLTLRPERPRGRNISRAGYVFGRQLGRWYALLDHCLANNNNSSTANEEPSAECLSLLRQTPLLFGVDGHWHRPCDFYNLSRGQTQTEASGQANCLFAWYRADYARLVVTSSSPAAGDSSGGDADTTTTMMVMAHSLQLLDARHVVNRSSSGHSSSSLESHREGTAHGFLLDVLGIPDIEQFASLTVLPAYGEEIRHHRMPCYELKTFFTTFLQIANLWLASVPKLSALNVFKKQPKTAEHEAFLVNNLQVELVFKRPLTGLCKEGGRRARTAAERRLAVVLEHNLMVDSSLGADVFACLSSLRRESTPALVYLILGLVNDCSLSGNGDELVGQRQTASLFTALADHLCPRSGRVKAALRDFMLGFLNIAQALQPDIESSFGTNVNFTVSDLHQLENYLSSHGVRRTDAKRVLHEMSVPQSTTVSTSMEAPTVVNTSKPPVAVTTSVDHSSSSSQIPTTGCRSFNTRLNTVWGELSAQTMFTRPIRVSVESSPSTAAADLWAVGTTMPDSLRIRLQQVMTRDSVPDRIRNSTTKSIGRLGEFYVFQRLMEIVRLTKNHENNFDQMAGPEFPTGHPLLGAGRIVECRWCNADVESGRPYDFELDVQVECQQSQWKTVLDWDSTECRQSVLRILRGPSGKKPGSILVGPIFLEVKSTASSSSSSGQDAGIDLFEVSVPELTCASQAAWRYHLLRVTWPTGDDTTVALDSPPEVVHVPDLVGTLRQASATPAANLRLCLAMISRSQC